MAARAAAPRPARPVDRRGHRQGRHLTAGRGAVRRRPGPGVRLDPARAQHHPHPRRGDRRRCAARGRLHLPVTVARGRAGRRHAQHLHARPVGRQRELARRAASLQRHHPPGPRAPQRLRQRLLAGRSTRADQEFLQVPHAQPRLVRHRLQLPRRLLRDDLGGPLRRDGTARPGRAHPRFQQLVDRLLRHRELRERPAHPADPGLAREARGLEALHLRPGPAGLDPGHVRGQRQVPEGPCGHASGHRRTPRHQRHRLPGRQPLRPDRRRACGDRRASSRRRR